MSDSTTRKITITIEVPADVSTCPSSCPMLEGDCGSWWCLVEADDHFREGIRPGRPGPQCLSGSINVKPTEGNNPNDR